jgi:AAA15 family ATPase/GTPase
MAFTSINIQNFRGIKSLEMDDFGQVNVFVGKNNSGKTSVLEALCIGNGRYEEHFFRDISEFSLEELPLLFHNLDVQTGLLVDVHCTDGRSNSIQMKPKIGINRRKKTTSKIEDITVTQKLRNKTQQLEEISYSLAKAEEFEPDTLPDVLFSYSWLHPKDLMEQLDEMLDIIVKKKRENEIIQCLAEIDTSIIGIRLGTKGRIYCDIGLPSLVPISMMGDGTRRILSIIANILVAENGIALIDEISNDLHYSTMEILWRTVLKAAKEFNVQVFATTHSYECLAALAKVQEANLFGEDIVRVFRLEREGEEHRAVKIDGEDLAFMTQKGWEIR